MTLISVHSSLWVKERRNKKSKNLKNCSYTSYFGIKAWIDEIHYIEKKWIEEVRTEATRFNIFKEHFTNQHRSTCKEVLTQNEEANISNS